MRILMIEDDKDLCKNITLALKQAGYETDCCHTGTDGLFLARSHAYDAIILDRLLPEADGMTVLAALRRQDISTPVILATALDRLNDRIDGLDAGADDYLVKPYAVEELMARLRAVTRRPGNLQLSNRLSLAGLSLDPAQHQLEYGGSSFTLSKKESALLEFFLRNPRQILPRNRILSYVWGFCSEVEDGNLDNYIYFLRRRLKAIDAPVCLTTIHGIGYRLDTPGGNAAAPAQERTDP
ncbi:DNA-binding response regulator [Clostridiaceae bacterium]|nr:DNA-binding response regulator [Clostridiaceae bacterium]RKI16487.1 DNA-binding response regulator [bacterium 1XD21-70]